MARLSIAVDDQLVDEVQRVSGAKTKREAFEIALTDYLRRKRIEELAGLAGTGLVDMDLEELEAWRAGGGRDGSP